MIRLIEPNYFVVYVMKLLMRSSLPLRVVPGHRCKTWLPGLWNNKKLYMNFVNGTMMFICASWRRSTFTNWTMEDMLTLSNLLLPCLGKHRPWDRCLVGGQCLINACMDACASTLMADGSPQGKPLWSWLQRRPCMKLLADDVMDYMNTVLWKAQLLVWVDVPATWRTISLTSRPSSLEPCWLMNLPNFGNMPWQLVNDGNSLANWSNYVLSMPKKQFESFNASIGTLDTLRLSNFFWFWNLEVPVIRWFKLLVISSVCLANGIASPTPQLPLQFPRRKSSTNKFKQTYFESRTRMWSTQSSRWLMLERSSKLLVLSEVSLPSTWLELWRSAGFDTSEHLGNSILMKVVDGWESSSKIGPLTGWLNILSLLVKLMSVLVWWNGDMQSSEKPLKFIFMIWNCMSGPDGIKESLVYVVPQINNTANVAGFSPSQWVLGYQPHIPGDLLSDDLGPQHLDGNSSFEDSLSRRNAAKAALLDVDLDMKLRRALLRKYEGDNAVLQTGQLCHFWRDAKSTDLVKIRWHGPAKVMIREDGPDGRPAVYYWLAFKTQLIRCAPHHVRPDFTNASQTLLGNLQEAKRHLRDLKSRGVTRYLDLNVANRRNLDDIEDDEQEDVPMDFDGDNPPDDPDDPQEPPRQRRRLLPFPHLDSEETQLDFEYEPSIAPQLDLENELLISPTSPAVPEDISDSPIEPGDPMLADAPLDLASVPVLGSNLPADLPQDSVPVPGIPPEPATSEPPAQPVLDPALAQLYAPAAPGEDFLRARRRVDLQETLSFRPVRQPPHVRPDPYDRPDLPSGDRPGGHPGDSDDALFGQVFTVEDVDPAQLPDGWTIHSDGCFYLTNVPRDFWEVRAGCLLRHHVIPRRQLFRVTDAGDAPFPESDLDFVRSTLVQHPNGGQRILNDDGLSNGCPTQSRWTGITVFQVKGSTRKELGMAAYSNPRQVTKDQKVKNIRNIKKDKDKNGVSERHLDLQQRELFQAAKVKELKSFFENGVWEFQTTREADPARTLSSRMLLKWAKNPDGTPRAKARLIVRGYSDIDALEGRVQTDSPTTSRLSRSLLLSISALCRWNGWTADVATAFLQGLPQERQLWVRLPNDALTILGASSECRMLLKKPCYGQLDAPRWFLEATRRLKQLGLRQHCMDPCLFMLYESDFPEEPATSKDMVVGEDRFCGLICIHVDDLLGTGCPSSMTYQKLEARLKEAFNFRERHDTESMEYCGASLIHNAEGWKLNHENYYKKLKPITVDKNRGSTDFLDSKDITQLRGLLGSLQWPAVQSSPHLQASASLLAGQLSTGNVETINEANRLLRFAKSNADVSLEYGAICPLEDLRLVCSFDAAFGVRRDGASQGGYITMLVPKGVFSGEEHPYHVVDWRSAKLPRIARSSLSAEAQAAGQAVDAVDHLCVFWSHILEPGKPLAELMHQPSVLEPTMVTDAKALYDSYQREALGNNLTDKRTGLEIRVMKERLEGLGGRLRWMSSERQFADGLTKFGTRQLLADRLRYGKVKYTWDPDYVASKRKGFEERQQSRQEFAQPSRARKSKQDEMDEEKNSAPDADGMAACAFELFMIDDGEAIVYKDVSGLAVSLLQNDSVHVNAMALDETEASADGEATIMKYNKLVGWRMFAAIIAVMVTPVETTDFFGQASQCLKDDEPEDFFDLWDLVWIGLAILGSWILIGCLCWWIGYHRGRKHILQFRHVRSERLGRLHAEVQRRLVLQEEENRRLQDVLHDNEVRVAELISLRELGKDLARRLIRELHEHLLTCPRNNSVCLAPVAGRVWHAHRQCSHLSCALRVEELPPCTYCADGPPFNVSLLAELREWLRMALLEVVAP